MKQKLLKTMLLLCALIAGSGTTWAATSTVNALKITSASVSWTGDADETWSVSVNGGATNQTVTNSYAQIGTRNSPSTSVTFSTSGISGTITQIDVDCASYSGLGTISATVGGSAFGTQSQPIPSWQNNAGGTKTFSGSASGNIVITMTNGSGGRAMYIKSITVTYTTGPITYTVTYDGNGSTGGTVPTDATAYSSGATVTVLGNTGSLEKTGYTFGEWNTQADGNGTNYAAGAKFNITANTTLYAKWTPIAHTVTLGDDNSTLTESSGGAGVDLPSRSNIGSYTFAGWSTTNATTETTTAPTIIPAGSYAPTSDITLYPVYTRVEGGGGPVNYTASVNIETYASAHDWENETQYDQFYLDENIRIDAYYDISGKYYSSDNSWRIYGSESGAFYIVPTNGAELTSATITLASGTLSHNNTNITSGSPVAISNESTGFAAVAGTAKVTAISVDYTISGVGTTYYTSLPRVSLSETTDNSEMLTDLNGETHTVTLTRTLKKTDWNTFCVPFNTAIPDGWTVKEFTSSDFDSSNGTLTLDFGTAESIEAGKPYLVMVGESDVVNPTFSGVTIVNSTTTTTTTYADFVPVLNPTQLTGPDKTKLYLSGENTLYYPSTNMTINGFRAYFQLNGLTAGDVASGSARAFVLNIGGDQTGIRSLTPDASPKGEGSIYTLDGRKVQNTTRKGVYIVNGKKVVVK